MGNPASTGRFARSAALAASIAAIGLTPSTPARADGKGSGGDGHGHGLSYQVVSPGESIQTAIDCARPGGVVVIRPGTYRETADATNGLNITKSIHLIGTSSHGKKVVLENSGAQKNAIVAVPADHTNCMGCHSSLAPPFPRLPGVQSSGRPPRTPSPTSGSAGSP